MPPLEIRYRRDSFRVAVRSLRTVQVCVVLLLAVGLASFSLTLWAASRTQPAPDTVVAGVFCALSGAGVTLLIVGLGFTLAVRREPPPAAVRLDQYGFWQWPMLSGDYVLPWGQIASIVVTDNGLSVIPVSISPGLLGAVGLTGGTARRGLHQQSRRPGTGVPWKFVEPVDPAHLEAAVWALSGNRCRVERRR